MNVKSSPNHSRHHDLLMWMLVFLLLAAGIVLDFHFDQLASAIKTIGWVILVAVMGLVALQTAKGQLVLDFAKESRVELRKVVWPTRQETVRTTMMVLGLVLLMSVIMWCVDSFLLWAVSWLTGQRG